MSDETPDVDPENPRPDGHYPRFADHDWHYVPDELAQSITLGPAGDGEYGQGCETLRLQPSPAYPAYFNPTRVYLEQA